MACRPLVLRCAALAALLLWHGQRGRRPAGHPPLSEHRGLRGRLSTRTRTGIGIACASSAWRRRAPRQAGQAALRCHRAVLPETRPGKHVRRRVGPGARLRRGQRQRCRPDDVVCQRLWRGPRYRPRHLSMPAGSTPPRPRWKRASPTLPPAAAADGHPFDLCDHITSGRMGGVCAAIGEERDDRVRAARLDRFAAALAPQARQPFARLRKAADAFAQKSADEVDMSGTGGAGFASRHTGRRDEEFMETLLKAASGKLPRADAAQLARARPPAGCALPQGAGHRRRTTRTIRSGSATPPSSARMCAAPSAPGSPTAMPGKPFTCRRTPADRRDIDQGHADAPAHCAAQAHLIRP